MPDTVDSALPIVDGVPVGKTAERLLNVLIAGRLEDGTATIPPREMQGQDFDGEWGGFRRERVTSCFPTITTDHAFIHEGIAYTWSGTAVVSGAYSLAFTTPASGYVHFKPAGITANGGPVTVEMVEGATATSGVAGVAYNRNRLNASASTVACSGAVAASGGTTIATLFIPSSTQGSQKLGSSNGAAEEFVLKQGTTYLLKFTETATGDVTVGYDLFWYEESGA